MQKKHNKLICTLNSVFLSVILLFNLSTSAHALGNDNTYTCYNNDKSVNGFYYVIEDYNQKEVIYCYNHDLSQPSIYGSTGYKKYDYFSEDIYTVTSEVKSQIAAILYAGYPNNALGFMEEFGVSEDEARDATQNAIWSLTSGNHHSAENISRNSYLHALYYYAEINAGSYGHTGSVSISEDFVLTLDNGVWKSNTLSFTGNYTGAISFYNLPDNITIYDANTNVEVSSSVKCGDLFYLVYSGEMKNDYSEILQYKYETTDIRFYQSPDPTYQDMIGIKEVSHNNSITITAKRLPDISGSTPELPGEEGTTPELPGDGGEAGEPEIPGIGGTTPGLPGEEGTTPELPGDSGEAGEPEIPGIGGTTPSLPGEEGTTPELPGDGGEAGEPEVPGIGGTTPSLPGEEGTTPELPGDGGEAGEPEVPGIGGTTPGLPGEEGTSPELPGDDGEAGESEDPKVENNKQDLITDRVDSELTVNGGALNKIESLNKSDKAQNSLPNTGVEGTLKILCLGIILLLSGVYITNKKII